MTDCIRHEGQEAEDCYHCRIEERLRPLIARMSPREPRWRYFEHRGWLYGWTTERMGTGKFSATIWQPERGGHRCVHEVQFAQRQRAKARARQWMEQARGRASGRPPASLLK